MPKSPWLYQKKPMMVVSATAPTRDQQPGPQFPDVLDEGHGAVGVGAASALSRVEPGQEFRGAHGGLT